MADSGHLLGELHGISIRLSNLEGELEEVLEEADAVIFELEKLLRLEEADPPEPFSPLWRPPKPPSYPVLARRALYGKGWARMWMVVNEDDEWGELNLYQDCDGPPGGHWVEYRQEVDWGAAAWDFDPADLEQFLMTEGIAPGQPFYCHWQFNSYTDYWGEYDEEVQLLDILDIESWDVDKVVAAWATFYFHRSHLLG